MSNYLMPTKHPITGEWELAEWRDNWFAHHHYGVKFPSEEHIYDPEYYKLKTKEELPTKTTVDL